MQKKDDDESFISYSVQNIEMYFLHPSFLVLTVNRELSEPCCTLEEVCFGDYGEVKQGQV